MAALSRKLTVAALGLGILGAVGASMAVADLAPLSASGLAEAPAWIGGQPGNDDTAGVIPVVSNDLFVARDGAPAGACLSQDEVLNNLTLDVAKDGGKTYVLGDGLDQAFANAWRSGASIAPVKVSGIVAHIFHDKGGSEWAADVIEIGADGCAISRTLLPGDQWSSLLKTAMGPEV